MKFISPYKWLEKQAKVVNDSQIILPKTDIMISLNNVSSAIDEYNEDLFLEKKIQLIQLIGLNLRNADKSYFNEWNQFIIKANPFIKVSNIFNNCKTCYDTAFFPNTLRNNLNPRLAELHILNNNEVIHCLEKGKIISPENFPILVEYFELLTSIDLTGFPKLEGIDIIRCKKCRE